MAVPKRIQDAKGSWRGRSQLNQSWLPPDERVSQSASHLHVDTDSRASYATIVYTWEHEGKGHEGTMLVCMDEESKVVQIGWCDSWHQASAVMHLVGVQTEADALMAKGSFSAGGETWGWMIALGFKGDALSLTMENVTPGGVAEWAVRATYVRD